MNEGDISKIREGFSIETIYKIKEVAKVLNIPNAAVVRENGQTIVLRKTASGEQEKVTVKTGFTNNANVEVLSGLSAGDIVYTIENAK